MADEKPISSRRRGAIAFAVVGSDPELRAGLERITRLLSEQLGTLIYPQVVRSYGALSAQLAAGGADIAWVPPLVGAELARSGIAELLLCLKRGTGGMYHSVIFARRERGLSSIASLKGGSMGWVDRHSAAGYVVPRRFLTQQGVDLSGYFARESFLHTHRGVAEAVLRGEVDAGATFAALEPRSRRVIDAGWFSLDDGTNVEVIASAGAVPADALAVSSRISPELRESLSAALLEPGEESREAMRLVFGSDGFEVASPGYRALLGRMVDDC